MYYKKYIYETMCCQKCIIKLSTTTITTIYETMYYIIIHLRATQYNKYTYEAMHRNKIVL